MHSTSSTSLGILWNLVDGTVDPCTELKLRNNVGPQVRTFKMAHATLASLNAPERFDHTLVSQPSTFCQRCVMLSLLRSIFLTRSTV